MDDKEKDLQEIAEDLDDYFYQNMHDELYNMLSVNTFGEMERNKDVLEKEKKKIELKNQKLKTKINKQVNEIEKSKNVLNDFISEVRKEANKNKNFISYFSNNNFQKKFKDWLKKNDLECSPFVSSDLDNRIVELEERFYSYSGRNLGGYMTDTKNIEKDWNQTEECKICVEYIKNGQKFTGYLSIAEPCPICSKPYMDMREVSIFKAPDKKWLFPEKLEHYLLEHSIKPEEEFIKDAQNWYNNFKKG